jgi:hypothetical protein
MEGKKEILDFLVHISLFKIRDTPSFVIKEIRMLVWRISDYASKGRHTLMGVHLLLVMKVSMSPFPYKGTQTLA